MEPKQNSFTLPVAIVVAGILVSGAILISKGGKSLPPVTDSIVGNNAESTIINVDSITSKDHLLGNPDSPVVLVEYSDLECPACKYFHPILNQAMDEYGKRGKLALVYRHFPLTQIHPKATKEAEATECVNELGGNVKFWSYVDKIFKITPANNGLDESELPKLASEIGIDQRKFEACLSSGKHSSTVSAFYESGVKAGVKGTPTSYLLFKKPLLAQSIKNIEEKTASIVDENGSRVIVVSSDGKVVAINAAFPYQNLKVVFDIVLAEVK